MIKLIWFYLLFIVVTIIMLKKQNGTRKDMITVLIITSIGAVHLGSIILQKPLDLNKLISNMLELIL